MMTTGATAFVGLGSDARRALVISPEIYFQSVFAMLPRWFGIVRHGTVQRCAVQHIPTLSMYRATAKLFVFRIRASRTAQMCASFGQERELDCRFLACARMDCERVRPRESGCGAGCPALGEKFLVL